MSKEKRFFNSNFDSLEQQIPSKNKTNKENKEIIKDVGYIDFKHLTELNNNSDQKKSTDSSENKKILENKDEKWGDEDEKKDKKIEPKEDSNQIKKNLINHEEENTVILASIINSNNFPNENEQNINNNGYIVNEIENQNNPNNIIQNENNLQQPINITIDEQTLFQVETSSNSYGMDLESSNVQIDYENQIETEPQINQDYLDSINEEDKVNVRQFSMDNYSKNY